MNEKLLVPDIGDFEKVEVIELLVKEGDKIEINDPVVTIESDKSSIEIPSTISGIIESITIKVGDKVSKGDVLLNVVTKNSTKKEEKIIPKDTENLIKEAAIEDTPSRSTGINKLVGALKIILPTIERAYKSLTTSPEQRDSYKRHLIKAIIDTLSPQDAISGVGDGVRVPRLRRGRAWRVQAPERRTCW